MLVWVKAFHVVFVVAWYAGLFYLPRLFVYHAETRDDLGHQRFCTMEKRLSILMSIAAVLTVTLGVWLIYLYGSEWFKVSGWLHAKISLVVLLVVFHGWCQVQVKKFREHRNTHSARFFRMANEVPTVLLVLIMIMVYVKPF